MTYRDMHILDIPRNRRERYVDYLVGAVLMAIFVTIAILVIPYFPPALRPPPIVINEVEVITPMPVCPGDIVSFNSHISVTEPAIIGIWSGILDMENNSIVPHSRAEGVPVTRPTTGELVEKVHFRVPELSSGQYARISGFAAINSDTEPAFVVVPFTVSDDCSGEEK